MTPEQSARHRESAQLRRRLLQLIQRRERVLSTVDLAVRLGLSRVTCWRYLNAMEADGVVSAIGQGRGTRWTTETARSHTERPEGQRPHVNYDFKRLDHYIPNQTFLLDEAARAQLHNLGQRAATRSATEVISRVRSKLLEDMSWASSRLEGNRYSLAETRRLFEDQSSAPPNDHDAVMLINHKEAIEFILRNIRGFRLDAFAIRTLHSHLAHGLIDPNKAGATRSEPVMIQGSTYRPLGFRAQIDPELTKLLGKAQEIRDPFECSFFLLANLSYLQAFCDVNKRTSRLACNVPLLQAGLCPLTFYEFNKDDYERAIVYYYETGRTNQLARCYLAGYDVSVERYKDLLRGAVSPRRVQLLNQYRTLIDRTVRRVITDGPGGQVEATLEAEAEELALERGGRPLADGDRDDLLHYIEHEIDVLDEPKAMRYGLSIADFRAYRNGHVRNDESDEDEAFDAAVAVRDRESDESHQEPALRVA